MTRPGETSDIFAALLDGGADPNAGNANGWTPLHAAVAVSSQPGIVASIRALLEAGADPNARDNKTGGTTLHVAAAMSGTPDIIEVLLEAGADRNARNEAGRKPFEVVPEDSPLRETPAYWRLKDGQSESP